MSERIDELLKLIEVPETNKSTPIKDSEARFIYEFVKEKRNAVGLTQIELAEKAGVGLRFVRDLEQGKQTLRLDKVNQVLQLFGFQLGPTELKREY